MYKCVIILLFYIGLCSTAGAEVACPTATINDDSELMKLQKDINEKATALQKQLDSKCLPEYQQRNSDYLKQAAAVQNKEGEYKKLSKSEREKLLTKMKYEYQDNQTKFSNECYGDEGNLLKEYKNCLRSIAKQHSYLQEQHKFKQEEEARKEKAQAAAAKQVPEITESAPAVEAERTANQQNSVPDKEVNVTGMVTTSTENVTTTASRTSSSVPSSAASGTTSSGSLFGDLTSKGIEIFGGMREIVYAVAGFGILAVAIGGFFGVINWRWLASIIIGLMVIASASSLINYMVDSDVISDSMITDSLIKGD